MQPTLDTGRSTLGINATKSFHLNLASDWHSVVPLSWPTDGAASNLAALDFVVHGRNQPFRTIVYFNDESLTMHMCNCLRKLRPPSRVHTVDILHAASGPLSDGMCLPF